MSPISQSDADDLAQKKRRPGGLRHLPKDRDAVSLGKWLTEASNPPKGWAASGFERLGRDKTDPCVLAFQNGRETRRFRFGNQRELMSSPRQVIVAVTDGWCDVPHLTPGEVEDVWVALCQFGRVLSEHDEVDEMRESMESLLVATMPLPGYSLVPDHRYDALMAIRACGEFTKPDALQLVRGAEDQYQRRPLRFIDKHTGDQWLRAGETATYLRWVLGVEPLSHSTLRSRLRELGVVGRQFEDYRPPHPKLALYQLSDDLIETVGGAE